jgi:hypothetical protein
MLVSTQLNGQKQAELNLQQVPSGVYWLQVSTEQGIIQKQIVKADSK